MYADTGIACIWKKQAYCVWVVVLPMSLVVNNRRRAFSTFSGRRKSPIFSARRICRSQVIIQGAKLCTWKYQVQLSGAKVDKQSRIIYNSAQIIRIRDSALATKCAGKVETLLVIDAWS